MSFIKQYDAKATEKIINLFNQIEKETYGLPRANLEAMQSVPLQTGVNKGALTYTYKIISELGMAKIIAPDARDLPPVSRGVKLKTVEIKNIGNSYSFNQHELDAWLFSGQPIDSADADTARRKIDEKTDEIIMNGDEENGLYGLLSNPNVPVITLTYFLIYSNHGYTTEMSVDEFLDPAMVVVHMLNIIDANRVFLSRNDKVFQVSLGRELVVALVAICNKNGVRLKPTTKDLFHPNHLGLAHVAHLGIGLVAQVHPASHAHLFLGHPTFFRPLTSFSRIPKPVSQQVLLIALEG